MLVAMVSSSSAARMKRDKQKKSACPEKVNLNSKGDCTDTKGLIIPDDCCDHLRTCPDTLQAAGQYYLDRARLYMEECEMTAPDVKDDKLLDDTQICSEKCQASEALKESADPFDIPSECKIPDHLQQMIRLIGTLDSAWSNCRPQTPSPSPSPDACATDCDGVCDFTGEWDEVHEGARGCVPSNTIHGTDKRWVVSQQGQRIVSIICPGYADHRNRENLLNPACFQVWGRRMCINQEKTLMYGPNGIVWRKRGSTATDTTWKDTSTCGQ